MRTDRPHSPFVPALRPTRLLAVIVALATAMAIAACGSSTQPPPQTAQTQRRTSQTRPHLVRSDLNFSKCMRHGGVPNFPDLPDTGIHIGAHGTTLSVNGVSVSGPVFQRARQRCEKYLPAGAEPGPAKQAQQYARGLRFSKCMRRHGVTNFPDPKTLSSSHGNNVVELAGVNPNSPAVQAAAKACGGGPKGP
jgi:hypothetical protein